MLKLNIKRRMKETLTRSAYKRFLPEMMIYMAVWGIILLFPVVSHLFDYLSAKTDGMEWRDIVSVWVDALPFLLLFVLNNCVLAPRLFLRQKLAAYVFATVLCVLLVFSAKTFLVPNPWMQKFPAEREMVKREMRRAPFEKKYEGGEKPLGGHRPDIHSEKRPPFFVFLFRGPFLGQVMIALLMFSFNIAVKLFFKSVRDEEALKELERHNLHSELAYLKYQINPHFFMNTLNNIHALVDIDTEKAKQTIVELSRLMRYMLYESDKRLIFLSKEVQFLRHYVELMRIRYPETVRIELSLPSEGMDVSVPPLLFVSFVENAFKHGVSYQQESFISVSLTLEGRELLFRCSNSCFGKNGNGDQHHGIGLENVRKRLQLLFDDDYTLAISELEQRFDVLLTIPVGKGEKGVRGS